MAKSNKKRLSEQEQQQPFDTMFKTWIKEQAREVLPLWLPGAIFLEALDVERIRPTMRVDRVFKVLYKSKMNILHIEFETGADKDMRSRLLVYNAILYYEYQLPVISIIVYPFTTKMAESPLQVTTEDQDLLTFHFLVLPLFELDAQQYVRDHTLCMYPLLPTMQGTDHRLIKQAVAELAIHYRDDQTSIADQFVWMDLLLERTETISLPEKDEIWRELNMYDQLWDQSRKAQEKMAESELRAVRRVLVNLVKVRFPDLAELAQERVAQINSLDNLDLLVQQVATAPNEATVRWLLAPAAA